VKLTYAWGGGCADAIYKDELLWKDGPTCLWLLKAAADLGPYELAIVPVTWAAWSAMGEVFPDTLEELEGYL
jgi:hypothetical protein